MKPIIKTIISPDVSDLLTYVPNEQDNFGFLLQLLIGPENEEGMESFQVIVCTTRWLEKKYQREDIIIGRHYLLVFEYNYSRIVQKIESYLDQCVGETWLDVAEKVARLGKWEFEDYSE